MASEQQNQAAAPEAPSTAAHTDPKPEAKKEGWFHKTFVRKGGQDDYPNGKAWSLEPPHPLFHQHDSKKSSNKA